MAYIEENLKKDEQIIERAKFNLLAVVPSIIAGVALLIYAIIMTVIFAKFVPESILFCIPFYIIAFLVPILTFVRIKCTHLVVTNKRVLGKRGILSISAVDIPIEKIDNSVVAAGFWGRIFKYYKLKFTSTGNSRGISFNAVVNAIDLKNAITDAIDNRAEEARLAQAQAIAMAMNQSK